jgi:hypothetical protein
VPIITYNKDESVKKLLLLSALLISGCASNKGMTIPGETHHQAIGQGYSNIESAEAATKSAASYCESLGKRHAVDDMTTNYKGTVSESTREGSELLSDVAAAAGVWIPSLGDDNDYQTTISFRCL